MKMILLNGSPRREGNTAYALGKVAERLALHGVESELLQLGSLDMHACLGCNACIALGRCVLDDGFNDVCGKIREADGFVIGSPVYFGMPRGDVLNFLQRLGMQHKKQGNFLNGKLGAPLAVGRRGGHTLTLQTMQMFFGICGMTVPGANYWNMITALEAGAAARDIEGIDNIEALADNIAALLKA